jgi:hypothetical protein
MWVEKITHELIVNYFYLEKHGHIFLSFMMNNVWEKNNQLTEN